MSRSVWEVEMTHPGLNKYRVIRGSDKYIVEQKARAQRAIWDEMWEKRQNSEAEKQRKQSIYKTKEQKKEEANRRTKEATDALTALEKILERTLTVNDEIDWGKLINSEPFKIKTPVAPLAPKIAPKPNRNDNTYQPNLNFLDKLFSSLRLNKERLLEEQYLSDVANWELKKAEQEKHFLVLQSIYSKEYAKWEAEKATYEAETAQKNEEIETLKNKYLNLHDSDAILEYCDLVLTFSNYPDYFPQDWNLEYIADTKILIVDYALPDLDCLPKIKAVKYIASRDEFEESRISDSEINRLYDNLIYQIALRTIHELYEADIINSIESIVFNGWVNTTDKSTGQSVNSCIVSVQASKDEFMAINLAKVDPKACFKLLKGVGSSKLYGISPVAPIISINKNDSRFVSPYSVVDKVDESVNLAAMDWQDFENLIREVFQKEFSSNGGEVKITQASRDGGVDAIAFDPDPIRGGKIVIQAKRYTNVVGVSAVRDLYGTTMNEGATKGILVTTANYGPDAYEFARGKPLTLLNGANLLHLLEKHGHKARINVQEAKQLSM